MARTSDTAACRTLLADLLEDIRGDRTIDAARLIEIARSVGSVCDALDRHRRRPPTKEHLDIVRRLLPILQEHEPNARIGTIRRKCGVKRSQAYHLYKLALEELDSSVR